MNSKYFDIKYAAYFRDGLFKLFCRRKKCIYLNDGHCGKICLINGIKVLELLIYYCIIQHMFVLYYWVSPRISADAHEAQLPN